MFKKIDKEMIKECVKDFEFYDNNGHFPWEKKKISITISYNSLSRLKENNKSKEIESIIN